MSTDHGEGRPLVEALALAAVYGLSAGLSMAAVVAMYRAFF